MLYVTDSIRLQDWELRESFMRASGPGGQNVNKVSSAVELRFAAMTSPSLPEAVKARLHRLAGRRMNEAGELVLHVDESRSQARNREIARARLVELIRRAATAPKPRIPTRPSYGVRQRRLRDKARRGQLKALRARPGEEE